MSYRMRKKAAGTLLVQTATGTMSFDVVRLDVREFERSNSESDRLFAGVTLPDVTEVKLRLILSKSISVVSVSDRQSMSFQRIKDYFGNEKKQHMHR